jgi:uncharacterized MAPEG superfamily protein
MQLGPELSYLVLSVAVYGGVVLIQAVIANVYHRPKELLGARDEFNPQNRYLRRAQRTLQNTTEALMMFAPLVLVAVIAQRTSEATALAAQVFFWARVAYVPAYILGVPALRTLIWAVGLGATIAIFLQVLPFS